MRDILIVEDNSQERERLQELFRSHQYTVEACDAVGKAERLLENSSYRLVILDIGLGDKSGSYLFNSIVSKPNRPQIIIFTGNPSVHLKERFLQSGAVDYIVKGSREAKNDPFFKSVFELIGVPDTDTDKGIDLDEFVRTYVVESSRKLFLDSRGQYPQCHACGSRKYVVSFSHQPQMPPEVVGEVRCNQCGAVLEDSVG